MWCLATVGQGREKCALGANVFEQAALLKPLAADALKSVRVCHFYWWQQGYKTDPQHCKVLMDDGTHGNPDHEGIINGFKWLVSGASEGDSLFMHYSGEHFLCREVRIRHHCRNSRRFRHNLLQNPFPKPGIALTRAFERNLHRAYIFNAMCFMTGYCRACHVVSSMHVPDGGIERCITVPVCY